MMSSPVTVVIVDDEPLARQKLRLMFEAERGFAVVGEACDGESAVRLISALRPRLACLDIRLPGLSGLDVLRLAHPRPDVIFTTAFDQYAITAFELAAVDYVLKPFSRPRFQAALARVVGRQPVQAALAPAQRLKAVSPPAFLARLFVRDRGVIRPIRASSVSYIESNDDAVIVHVGAHAYTMNVSLSACESRVDPAMFLRIHRRYIVNLDHVVSVTPIDGSRYRVLLRDGTALEASRTRSRGLRPTGAGGD